MVSPIVSPPRPPAIGARHGAASAREWFSGRRHGSCGRIWGALIRQPNKATPAAKEHSEVLAFVLRCAMPLQSIINANDIDTVLQRGGFDIGSTPPAAMALRGEVGLRQPGGSVEAAAAAAASHRGGRAPARRCQLAIFPHVSTARYPTVELRQSCISDATFPAAILPY